jgi:hypothetical protein
MFLLIFDKSLKVSYRCLPARHRFAQYGLFLLPLASGVAPEYRGNRIEDRGQGLSPRR